jgi:hypothetical protein
MITRTQILLPSSAILILLLVAWASYNHGVPIAVFTKDMAGLAKIHPLISVVSSLGAFVLAVTGAICLFAHSVAKSRGDELTSELFYGGILTFYITADDFYQFHDVIFPKHFGINEKLVYLSLALAAFGYLAVHRRSLLSRFPLLLLAALFCFAVSVIADVFDRQLIDWMGQWMLMIEDGSKFLGIGLWASYFISLAHGTLLSNVKPKESA